MLRRLLNVFDMFFCTTNVHIIQFDVYRLVIAFNLLMYKFCLLFNYKLLVFFCYFFAEKSSQKAPA